MSALPFTDHPCLPMPTREEVAAIVRNVGEARAAQVLAEIERKRRETIALAKANPFAHGWELPWWKDADALLAQEETRLLANLGGNGTSKTWWMVKRAVQTVFRVKEAKVLLLHEDEDASRDLHQALAYYFLPPELKPRDGWKPKKTTTTNIFYDSKIGFSGNAFTTPNGGRMRFGFYRQDLKRFEGMGYTLVGLDENAPLSWIETLQVRLGRAGGKMIWCFTAIDGITPAVAAITAGARTIEHRPVDPEILPKTHKVEDTQDWPEGTMPYIRQGTKAHVKILYPHAVMNPLAGYAPEEGRSAGYGYRDLKTFLADKPAAVKERRAYGYSRKSARNVFPLFGAAHVVPDAKLRERLRNSKVTRYQIIDPAGSRNFFMIWFAVDKDGRHFIYREWPDVPTYGEWALPSDDAGKWDGKIGPAQAKAISGVVAYKREILLAEGWTLRDGQWQMANGQGEYTQNGYGRALENLAMIVGGHFPHEGNPPSQGLRRDGQESIFDRYVDPRSGATESMASDAGESSVIDRFRQEQTDDAGRVVGPAMILTPAISGKTEEDGLTQIDELLSYNPQEPITALLNEPKLLVSDACENVIWALQNYTAHDGPKAACKDPVDCVRYMALKQCVHVHSGALDGIAGGGWR